MKKKQIPSKPINVNTKVSDVQNNAVGGTDMRKNRNQALNLINVAKKNDLEKISIGYIWMFKDRATKLVSPVNIDKYISEDWKIHK